MTIKEYLVSRGWSSNHTGDSFFDSELQPTSWVAVEDVVIIQRARDAKEEREAWDRYVSMKMSLDAVEHADIFLKARRKRFPGYEAVVEEKKP